MDKNKAAIAASAVTAVGLIYVNWKLNLVLKKTSFICQLAAEAIDEARQAAFDHEFVNIIENFEE